MGDEHVPTYVYGDRPETLLRASARNSARRVNHVLLGTLLKVLGEDGDWYEVSPLGLGQNGWVRKDHTRDLPALKVFFVDVGQGDGAIIESPEGIMVVDGGPNSNFFKFMKHRYRFLLRAGHSIRVKAMVVSHPDWDHYNGLRAILTDDRFEVDRIYHNGIIRYDDDNEPPGRDFDLGTTEVQDLDGTPTTVLTETFDTLDDIAALIDDGHLAPAFRNFWQAALDERAAGRTQSAQRLTVRDAVLPGYDETGANHLHVEVLAPVPTATADRIHYVTFPDTEDIADTLPRPSSSHTRNGHSIVLKLTFGDHTLLLGGDLNIPAQQHLMRHYGDENPFRVDVAKACHHGSSDYHVDYLKLVLPQVNVFSSGDNKSFDHPMADAVGASARHTRGDHPLLFSTELARAASAEDTHYGLINMRSNGTVLTMAQMKEQRSSRVDIWDSFTVPWPGKFHEEIEDSEQGD